MMRFLTSKLESKRFVAGGAAAGLITAGLMFARYYGNSDALYSTFCTAIVSLAGLYMAGDTAQAVLPTRKAPEGPQRPPEGTK